MIRRSLAAASIVLLTLTPASEAQAAAAAPGVIVEWSENGPNTSPSGYHGRLVIQEADGTLRPYHWGGTLCRHVQLAESIVDRLWRVFEADPPRSVTLQFRFASYSSGTQPPGKSPARCIIGFTAQRPPT